MVSTIHRLAAALSGNGPSMGEVSVSQLPSARPMAPPSGTATSISSAIQWRGGQLWPQKRRRTSSSSSRMLPLMVWLYTRFCHRVVTDIGVKISARTILVRMQPSSSSRSGKKRGRPASAGLMCVALAAGPAGSDGLPRRVAPVG